MMRNFIHKLQAVGCPYLDGMDEPVIISEVMFTPGEARTRILTWLTERIHPNLQPVLSFQSSSTTSTIPKLTSFLCDLGLCSREDYEVVKGTTSRSKQLMFLETLVDLVALAGPQHSDCDNDKMKSVPWKMERSCHFIDNLCRHEDLSVIFPSSISLLPPGIRGVAPREGHSRSRTTPPLLSELDKSYNEMRSLLEEKQLELENIMETHAYAELKPGLLDSSLKMMEVTLGTLTQLVSSFCHSYEAEIQPWANRHQSSQPQPLVPSVSSLGPLCKRVVLLKQQLDKLFHALDLLEASFKKLDRLSGSLLISDKQDQICISAHQVLKDCLSILTK